MTDFNANKYMTQQSDSPSKIANESNFVTDEAIQAGITQSNRREAVNDHVFNGQAQVKRRQNTV